MGKEVRVSPVAIMHGNLTVEIQTGKYRLAAGAVLAGAEHGGPAGGSQREGREVAQLGAQAGCNGGTTGARSGLYRIYAARCDCDSAKLAGRGSARSGYRRYLDSYGGLPYFRSIIHPWTGDGLSIGPPQKTDSPQKIKDAAGQFESLMVGQILKSAHEEEGGWMGAGEEDQTSASTMQMADEYFARALTAQARLGLGTNDYEQLRPGLGECGGGSG